MKMICGLNNSFSLISPDLGKIIEDSLTIPGFPWLFIKMAYFPGFSMSPVLFGCYFTKVKRIRRTELHENLVISMGKPRERLINIKIPCDADGCCESISMNGSDNDRFLFPFFGELFVSLDFGSSGFAVESFLAFDIISSIIGLRLPVSSFI